MLVDFKAGLEDSARGILTSVDWALAVVDPTVASIQTAAHLTRMVEQIHRGVPPATDHLDSSDLVEIARRQFERARILGVKAVLNRTQNIEVEGYLRGSLGIRGVEIAGTIRHDPAIEGAWLRGSEVSASWPMYDADQVVEAIEDAVEAHRAPTFKV